jgi:DNA-binding transcriptional LysR family regulator
LRHFNFSSVRDLQFAVREIVPRLAVFLPAHPALRVEFALSDQRQDLVADAIDVAILIGPLPDSAAVVLRAGSHSIAVLRRKRLGCWRPPPSDFMPWI